MGSTPQNERDANRFAGKINVPGSPVMLKQHRKHNVVVRTTSVAPDDAYSDGFRDPGNAYIKDEQQKKMRRKAQ